MLKAANRKNILIEGNGRRIDADFYEAADKKAPLLIISHGYNGYKTDFETTAFYMASHGIHVLCHTFCGGSTRDTSGFPTTQMSLFTEKEDLGAILDEVQKWEAVDKENIFLFGASQGGMVSALLAEERSAEIRALLLLYPAFCIVEDWNKRFPALEEMPIQEELWGMMLGKVFFESIHGLQVEKMLGKYNGPVFIMHGSEDVVVAKDYGEWAARHYKNAVLEVFEGEGHGFSQDGNRRMEAMLLYFIHHCI